MSQTLFIERAQGRIAYSRAGSGPLLVLLHPIGIDRRWWDDYVAAWQADFDVIAMDFRGHGESSPVTAPISLSDHASDVAALLREVQAPPAHLIGVSMGGMVAQQVAINHPELTASLILCATAGTFPDDVRPRIRTRGDTARAGAMTEVVDGTLERWFLPDSPQPDMVARCRKELLAEDWYGWSANWEAISALETLAGLAHVNVPALVVAAQSDASIPPALVERIALALPGARFVRVPDTSHFGVFETPTVFEPLFRSFLAQAAR